MTNPFPKIQLTLLFVFLLGTFASANAQSRQGSINCGDIVEAELTPDSPIHDYTLLVKAGTTLNGRVEPIGSTLNLHLLFLDSGGSEAGQFNSRAAGGSDDFANFIISSSNPILSISGVEPRSTSTNYSYGHFALGRYFGAYTIYLGCTLRDGTVINPGDLPPQTESTSTSTPAFSGVGFPGLAPVDFAGAVKLPLIIGTPMAGAITPTGGEILGFTLDANANDKLDLIVARLSGNLNLGVVILSADNKVVFYGGLITSESLSTRLTLPSAGQYTIGVFRVDLLPPDAPQATAFQVTGTLNP